MANPFSKGWKYLMQSLDMKIDENADPKVQIQQATEAAKRQHQQITESAARVIGNRNQLEMQLNRLIKDREALEANTRTAIQQADAATAAGDQAKGTELSNAAEIFATQLVTVEQQIEQTKQLHAQASQAADQAQQQQAQSATRLQEQLAQIDQLRAQVDQAKMQETSNQALETMQGIQADDSVPTLDGVRAKIEARYANALGAQELTESSVAGRMAEIEESGRDMAAASRLEQIRAEMHGGTAAQQEVTAGEEQPAIEGAADATVEDAAEDADAAGAAGAADAADAADATETEASSTPENPFSRS
ncbi:PspA/IM30 family protein [Corynebacterium terpenotabidum]|uniref:Rod-shaped morphology protein n=1 Tax=Corynebacterium terpenotabidum Y-11 TaxID=1200352 RepID=S4XJQ8_9CORY|nr:PspA/IM30 family protein [Corynebacterium terpenotabidum]AGP31985.1 rod-shaped morphology protein [Corynebacterium terpenotabidum Y-11]